MSLRTRSIGLITSVLVLFSLVFSGVATNVNAAGARNHTSKRVAKHVTKAKKTKKAAFGTACKKANKQSGTIKFSDWQFPDTMNPTQSTLAVTFWILNAEFDALYGFDNKAKLFPQIASDIPTVKNGGIKNGGKTWTVHLKKGLRWSDGSPETAADVKFGWQIGMDPITGPLCSGSCDAISRIDTPDQYTLVFHFKQAYAPALSYAINGFTIWPQKWPNAWNGDAHAAAVKLYQDPKFNFEDDTYPTNGAYQIQSFANNDRIVLKPMKYYRGMNCGAMLQNLIFAFYSSKDGLIAAAARKETDVTEDYTVADIPALQKNKSAFKTVVTPSFFFEHLEFNVDKQYNGNPNPLANRNVRLALALAIDKYGVIKSSLSANDAVAKGIASWSPLVNTPRLVQPFAYKKVNGQWDPMQKKYDPNTGTSKALADAKALLAKTPFKNGFKVDYVFTAGNPTRQAEAAVIQNNWAKLGVSLNIINGPASKVYGSWDTGGILIHGQFQVAEMAFIGKPDPDQVKFNLQSQYCSREHTVHAAIDESYSCMHDKVLDKAFDQGASSFSKKVRAKAYAAFQARLNQQAYWVGLYFRSGIDTTDGKVKPFKGNPTQLGSTWNIYDWSLRA